MQYTLYALRQRQLAGKPIRGAKTLRRRAHKAATDPSDTDNSDDDEDEDDYSSSVTLSGSGGGDGRQGGGGAGGKLEKTKARARALSSAVSSVLDEADKYRSRRSSDFAPPSSSVATAPRGGDAASVVSLRQRKPEASELRTLGAKERKGSDRLSVPLAGV